MDVVDGSALADEILIELDAVKLLQDEKDEGSGKLVLTTVAVKWTGTTEERIWDYRDILMHAISKEDDCPAIYAQLKGTDEFDLLEVRFVPQDSTKLDSLYAAFSRGACLNPDEAPEDEDAGNFYFDANEVADGLNGGDFDDDEDVEEDQSAAPNSS